MRLLAVCHRWRYRRCNRLVISETSLSVEQLEPSTEPWSQTNEGGDREGHATNHNIPVIKYRQEKS